MNFDEQYKVENSNCNSSGCLFAKYDKCYCFSLRFDLLGCFGVIDENYTEDVWIDYFIPAGEYCVTFTDSSTAKIGSVMIYSNDQYTVTEGYPYITQYDYRKYGEKKIIQLQEDQHVFITVNSVFVFQRTDVPESYVDYSLKTKNFPFLKVFLISFCSVFSLCIILALLTRKKRENCTEINSNRKIERQ